MRSDTNDLRLFEELRLNPWKPDNKVKIDAFLAMLGVTDPVRGSDMAARYIKKMDEYLAKNLKGKPMASTTIEAKPLEPKATHTSTLPKKGKKK